MHQLCGLSRPGADASEARAEACSTRKPRAILKIDSDAVPGEELFHVGEDVVAEHHGFARDEEAVELVVGEELAGGGGGGVVGEEEGGAVVGAFTLTFIIIFLVEG